MEVCCLHTRDVINHSGALPAIPGQACRWGADPERLRGPSAVTADAGFLPRCRVGTRGGWCSLSPARAWPLFHSAGAGGEINSGKT